MFLITMLALAAFGLAATAGFFSIIGLATTYAGSFWAVVALGCTIEYGKLVGISFLYRFWARLSVSFRIVLITMIVVVMLITSFGTFGFLTKANQTDMVGLKQTDASQALLKDEEARLATRKLQIDQQIAQLKPDDVQGRIRLNRQFNTEMKEINTRLPQIAKEKASLANSQIKQQADIGPLVYLAKSLKMDVDIATTWFTLLLVAALDPLAVILTVCTNIAIATFRKPMKVTEAPVGTDGLRPAVPATGSLRWSDTTNSMEMFNGTDWVAVHAPTEVADDEEEIVPYLPSIIPQPVQWTWTTSYGPTETEPAPNQAVVEQITDALMDWTPAPEPVEEPTPSAFPAVVSVLEQQPESTQQELDFNAPLVQEEQPLSGTLTELAVAIAALDAVFKDSPTYFKQTPTADEAESAGLLEEVAIAQGPQPTVDATGVPQNTFGQANRVAWDNFATVSNDIVNNREHKSTQEFQTHLDQLRAYVEELDNRTDKISDDEFALRSRILAFIQRHQSPSQV